MKKRFIPLFCLFLCAKVAATPVAPTLMEADLHPEEFYSLRVEYPHQDKTMASNIKNTFLFGRVYEKDSVLKVNGQEISLYKNGSFLTFQPVHAGKVDFIFELISPTETKTFKRTVFVPGFDIRKYENKYKFEGQDVFPASEVKLREGDTLEFSVRASPNRKITLSFGFQQDILMQESVKDPGLYSAQITFNKGDVSYRAQKAIYKIYDEKDKVKSRVSSSDKIRIYPKDQIITIGKLKKQSQRLRPFAQTGEHILETRLYGKVKIVGQLNNFYKIQLANGQEGWLEQRCLQVAPYFSEPKNNAWKVSLEEKDNKSVFTVGNNNKVSFKTNQTPTSFEILLFNTQLLNTPQKNLKTSLFNNVEFETLPEDVQKITLNFAPNTQLWGFDFDYKGDNLVFNFYHTPKFKTTHVKPLKDVRIVLDPGHSPKRVVPYDGAVGPSGMLEYEVNYKIALKTKEKLQALGAQVFMSKEEGETMPLSKRQDKVLEEKAHLFISLHNNALPDSINPLSRPRGFTFYYYYPHSYTFAEAIERSFVRSIALPDEGIIQRDFSVTRSTPQVPAILIEHAYMLLPEQEDLLSQDSFIDSLAQATTQGVVSYIKDVSRKTAR